MGSSKISRYEENLIPRLTAAVYPSFALLAGMQLDLFTPLNDGPMSVEQISAAITEQEHKDWLEEAGFGDFERIILPDESSIITARKMK